MASIQNELSIYRFHVRDSLDETQPATHPEYLSWTKKLPESHDASQEYTAINIRDLEDPRNVSGGQLQIKVKSVPLDLPQRIVYFTNFTIGPQPHVHLLTPGKVFCISADNYYLEKIDIEMSEGSVTKVTGLCVSEYLTNPLKGLVEFSLCKEGACEDSEGDKFDVSEQKRLESRTVFGEGVTDISTPLRSRVSSLPLSGRDRNINGEESDKKLNTAFLSNESF
ncbi:MAG: hypothetical protein S4CHLAM7_11760 [Chlamydiae bacterium]|nr:hypothetical protein [Chlamydiota bacterium]